jgi:hypothetical protein
MRGTVRNFVCDVRRSLYGRDVSSGVKGSHDVIGDRARPPGSAARAEDGQALAPARWFRGEAWRQELAEELIGRARSEGVQLTGPGGLLTGITQMGLETVLETELADHLGYDKGDPAGGGRRMCGTGIRLRRCTPMPGRCGASRWRRARWGPRPLAKAWSPGKARSD